jgi:hypothetical protein
MSEFFEFFVQIENLLFSTALLVFVGLLSLQFLGMAGDVGLDAVSELELGGEIGGGMDGDGLAEAASYPLIFMLIPLCGSFGFLGLLLNWTLPEFLDIKTGYITLISVGVSGLASWESSKLLASFFGRLLPQVESYGLSETDLAGCLGSVVGAKLGSEVPDRISVTDARGGSFTVKGLLAEGHPEVSRGGLIRVVKHDAKSNVCFCEPVSAAVESES